MPPLASTRDRTCRLGMHATFSCDLSGKPHESRARLPIVAVVAFRSEVQASGVVTDDCGPFFTGDDAERGYPVTPRTDLGRMLGSWIVLEASDVATGP